MAKKTRTELSTLAINTNLPDNTQELITPTTERSQLTDERESVVNYKDDLGGAPNAGKFLTVAVDGESLTMVNEPSGVPDWVTFITAVVNQMLLKAGGDGTGTSQSSIKFTSYDGSITSQINFNGIDGSFYINGSQSQIQLTTAINFIIGGTPRLTISSGGETFWGSSPKQAYVYVDTTNDIALIGSLGSGMDLGFITGTGTNKLTITSGGEIQVGGDAALVWGTNNTTDPYIQAASSGDMLYFGRANGWQMAIKSDNVVDFKTGIRFPNGGNTTLDAYEEGNWTPTMNTSQGNLATFTSSGTYTRIGRLVSLQITYTLTVTGTPTASGGAILVQNIPFSKIGNEAFLSGFGQQPSAGKSLIAFNYASGNTTIGIYRGDGNFAGAVGEVSVITVQYLTP